MQNPEPLYGLSVTGLAHPDRLITNSGAATGDLLVLTKPLGTGILATATKQGLLSVVTESRNRHSVLQVAVPLELDAHDPVHLRDEQTCQVHAA